MKLKQIVSMMSVTALVFALVPSAYAANLTSVKDTLSNSAPSLASNHSIQFTTPTGLADGYSVRLAFPAGFDLTSTALALTDFDVLIGATQQTLVTAEPGAGEIQVDLADVATGVIVLDLASDVSLPANAALTVNIGNNATQGGAGTTKILNPATTGSYRLTMSTHNSDDGTGANVDEGSASVAIVNQVTVTATVQSSLTFTITGVNDNTCMQQDTNGDLIAFTPTMTNTTDTQIAYGNLDPNTAKTACQRMRVSTNATGGYVTTAQQTNNFLAANGVDALADFTDNGQTDSAVWTASEHPTGTMSSGKRSWFGYHGSDSDYTAFRNQKYGSFSANSTPYDVASAAGPVSNDDNFVTYKIEVNNLQEAGVYSTVLMYICTATF